MILDSRNQFCAATALNTGAAGTYLLGNQIDLGPAPAPGPMGGGDTLYLVLQASTGIKAAGAGTVSFALVSDDTASIATNGSATQHLATASLVTSTTSDAGALKAGTVLLVAELPRGFNYERYLGILQTTGTSAITGGAINAFLTRDPALWAAYDAPFQL